MLTDRSALLIIDVQQGFDDPKWGVRNNPDAESNIELLLKLWRKRQSPVIHVQHCSIEPNSPLRSDRPGCAFKSQATPIAGEPVFKKSVNSSFIGTELEAYLRENMIETLVIVGLTTDHCVSTTTRMAGNLGFRTYLVSDATATFDRKGPDGKKYSAEEMHSSALASLHGEFATVIASSDLLS